MQRRTLLERQLHRIGVTRDTPPTAEQWRAVLAAVDRTYAEADRDRYTLERSLSISSTEMRELYEDLKRSSETQLAQANRFLDSIIEHLPLTVFVKDAEELRYVRVNRAGEELFGWSRDELVGKTVHECFPIEQAEIMSASDRGVLAQRGVVTHDAMPLETRYGSVFVNVKMIPIVDDRGAPLYLLGICEDITDKLHKQHELAEAKEEAERASRAKSDFLMNMSHEMRTPLNAIMGFTRILERRCPFGTEEHEFLGHVVQASEHMLQLVNDLLDLRALDASRLDLRPLDLGPVIHDSVALVGPLFEQRSLVTSVAVPDNLPPVVADRRAVAQILFNLLSNAAKFTPEGGAIAVEARLRGSAVHVAVRDTGIGIAPEDQVKLFTYFEQLGGKHESHMKGSGVGLALTRALVERQGGAITVESTPGRGSTFDFHLAVAS